MKHLVIYAHPTSESLNAQLKSTVVEDLISKGQEVQIRDLYELNFDPVLTVEEMSGYIPDEIKVEQDLIIWADCITFIHPIWWTGLPAIIKGYIDRVFSYCFAYCYHQGVHKGLLSGKQVVIINTQGKSHAEYSAIGLDKALSLISDHGIYKYCGLEIKKHFFFDSAGHATSEKIEEWKRQIREVY